MCIDILAQGLHDTPPSSYLDIEQCKKDLPKGFTQKLVGSTGSRTVMCPAIPSEKPHLAKIRYANASLCLRNFRSSTLSSKTGATVCSSRTKASEGSPERWPCCLDVAGESGGGDVWVAEGAMMMVIDEAFPGPNPNQSSNCGS